MDHKEAIERIKARFNKWALDDKDLDAIKTIVPELRESENERMLRIIENVICTNEGEVIAQKYGLKLTDLADWLEKIKEYINSEKPKEWSEKDENHFKHILDVLEGVQGEQMEKGFNNLNSDICWFESLRLRSQPKQEWSEKDEDMLNSIIATCQLAAQDRDSGPARHLLEMQEKFLESFRSRPKSSDNWNPSEEQTEVDLENYLENYFKGWHTEEEIGLTKPDGWSCIVEDLKDVARHFYELGRAEK